MKQKIFITATNTDVGKTYSCKRLLEKYTKQGYKVGYFKPIETGVVGKPLDGTMLLEFTKSLNPDFKVDIDDVVPYQFKLPAAPFVAKDNITINIEFLKKKADYLLDYCDILFIEGAGGLMVPIEENYFMIDFIKDIANSAILISPSNLGCINDTLLSYNTLKSRDIKFEWFINLYKDKDSFHKVTLPFYEKYFKDGVKYI